jgi:hypothetical protein
MRFRQPIQSRQAHRRAAAVRVPAEGCVLAWWLLAGDAMKWRIMLELAGPDGMPRKHEIGAGERTSAGHAAAALGLGLEEGRAILAALVAAQGAEHRRGRRRCRTPLRRVRGRAHTAAAEGLAAAAPDPAVRRGGDAGAALRSVPLRRRMPTVDHAGGGDHARSLHARVRARRRLWRIRFDRNDTRCPAC